ncbi:MAG: hypothetical protein KQI62_02325 [Deltaproteobacteria bacterium]|nr:hypothetical protein [Deltaproteobacteria bacterium]
MKRAAVIALALLVAGLMAGCASNEKKVTTNYLDASGKITKQKIEESSVTDTASQGNQQLAYAKLLQKHKLFEIKAARTKTITETYVLDPVTNKIKVDADGNPIVSGRIITEGVSDIHISGAASIAVSAAMPAWKQVEEAWVKALRQANGWINMAMFGWLFGPQNYDTGTTNYNLATSGQQSPINVGGKQTPMGSNVTNTGEGQATGGSLSTSDSSQQNQGDQRGFGDIGSVF